MTTGSLWGDQQVELLTTLWKSGMPAKEIAQRMSYNGYKYTKNSVLGKIFRLGLCRNGERNKKVEQRPKIARRVRKKTLAVKMNKYKPQPEIKPEIPAQIRRTFHKNGANTMGAPDASRRVLLTDTRDHHCRAIVDYQDGVKAKAVCCGEDTIWVNHNGHAKRSSWCRYHFARYTQDPRKRYE